MMLGNRDNLIGCEYFSTINIIGHKNIATAKPNNPKLKKVNVCLMEPIWSFLKVYVENQSHEQLDYRKFRLK